MFQFIDKIRHNSGIHGIIFFFGYLYLAFWNHLFNKVPSYIFRYYIAKYLYGLKIGKSNIHYDVKFLSPWKITIGDNCNIQMECFLDGRGDIAIHNNVDITIGVKILTEQHDINSPDYDTIKKEVVIKDNAVIGSYSLILPGVTINEGAVIAAGSVVPKNIPEYVMAAGNPAIVKRDRNKEINYKLNFKRPFH
ncbi:MAG: acyltransferase [Pseudomonadota bacterium]